MDTLEIGVVIAGAGACAAYVAGLLTRLLPEVAPRVQDDCQVARFNSSGPAPGR